MTRAPTIARREITSYFYSPIAYVALTLFLLVAGFFFNVTSTPVNLPGCEPCSI